MSVDNIENEIIEDYLRKHYSIVEKVNVFRFFHPHEGLEKVNDKEFRLHIYNSKFIIPFGAVFIVRLDGKNIEIEEMKCESSVSDIYRIMFINTSNNICLNLRTFEFNGGGYISIRLKDETTETPEFAICDIFQVTNSISNTNSSKSYIITNSPTSYITNRGSTSYVTNSGPFVDFNQSGTSNHT